LFLSVKLFEWLNVQFSSKFTNDKKE